MTAWTAASEAMMSTGARSAASKTHWVEDVARAEQDTPIRRRRW
ncbi:hypothetical protein [Kitasatospora sp. NPDC058046]